MSSRFKPMLMLAAIAATVSLAMSVTVGAQNPPARGMRWTKAAPFPTPEEELYGTVINGKFYVVGGFGFNPDAGSGLHGARRWLPAGAGVRVRPGSGQVDQEEGHPRQGAPPGPGRLQRQ